MNLIYKNLELLFFDSIRNKSIIQVILQFISIITYNYTIFSIISSSAKLLSAIIFYFSYKMFIHIMSSTSGKLTKNLFNNIIKKHLSNMESWNILLLIS